MKIIFQILHDVVHRTLRKLFQDRSSALLHNRCNWILSKFLGGIASCEFNFFRFINKSFIELDQMIH